MPLSTFLIRMHICANEVDMKDIFRLDEVGRQKAINIADSIFVTD